MSAVFHITYLALDPWLKVTVLPLIVKRVPAGEFREKSYLPAMSKNSTPVYLTAKLYVLAAISALTPLNDKAAACTTFDKGHPARRAELPSNLCNSASTAREGLCKYCLQNHSISSHRVIE